MFLCLKESHLPWQKVLYRTVSRDCSTGDSWRNQVQKLALSDNTMQRRCSLIAASLKENFFSKLRSAPCFGLHLGETTDITSQAQLIVYVCFPDWKASSLQITVYFVFLLAWTLLLQVYFQNKTITPQTNEMIWSKCMAAFSEGAWTV